MSAIQRPTFTPGTVEWSEQRRNSVGGSEIAALLGLSPWESRFSLWHRKRGAVGPQDDNDVMEWGRRLEGVIATKYAELHSDFNVRPGGTWIRDDRSYQIAAPDRIIHGDPHAPERFLLEVKTAHYADGWGEPGTDEIPIYYRAQCLWYLDTLDLERCDVAVLIGGSDYREYAVTYHEADVTRMREAAQSFIASIAANERPPIDESDATYQTLRQLHPDIEQIDVEIPAHLAAEFCRARQAARDANDEQARTSSEVLDALGTGRRATYLGYTIATRQARGNGTPYLVAGRNLPTYEKAA